MQKIKVLALDLERTLISDAMNREPRPGLFDFLQFCVQQFERIVLFTSVNRKTALDVLQELQESGFVPPEFAAKVEYVEWSGTYKDLRFVPNAALDEIVFIDDDAGWVLPGQEAQYLAIAEYDPYLVRGTDTELERVRAVLERQQKRLKKDAEIDEEKFAALCVEFAEEDHEMAEEGIAEFSAMLKREDTLD